MSNFVATYKVISTKQVEILEKVVKDLWNMKLYKENVAYNPKDKVGENI